MTRILPLNIRTAPLVYTALRRGELIVLPTDTVYGVAALLDEAALARLYAVKGRPEDRPIPVLLSDPDRIEQVCTGVPEAAHRLIQAFWPGPLTLVLPRVSDLPSNLTAGPTVGVRVPDHDLTRAIIRAAGGALAVTSANLSDSPPALTAQDAFAQLGAAVAYYLDDGPAAGGTPSTVAAVDTSGGLRILRQGAIAAADLQAALGS